MNKAIERAGVSAVSVLIVAMICAGGKNMRKIAG